MDDKKRGLLNLHIAILIFGGTGLFSKLIALPAIDIITYRSFLAAITLLIILYIKKSRIRLFNRNHLLLMVALGILMGIHWVSYFTAMQVSGVAVGMVALFTYPVMTVFMEPFFYNERPSRKDILCGCAMLIGVFLIVPEFTTTNNTTLGVCWGIFSAFFFSLRNVLQKRYLSGYGGITSMFYQATIAGIVALPFVNTTPNNISLTDWGLLIALSIVFTALPHSLFTSSLAVLKAKSVGLIASLQPLYGAFFAFLILNEQPSLATILGGAIILGAASYESYSTR